MKKIFTFSLFSIVLSCFLSAESIGTLERRVIDTVVKQDLTKIKHCYERALENHDDLSGKIVIHFTIEPNGTVSLAEINSSTMDHPDTELCVAAVVKNMKFPSPANEGRVLVNYPFIFKPAE